MRAEKVAREKTRERKKCEYARLFHGRLSFRDVTASEDGVGIIDEIYGDMELTHDPVGQHYCMSMALSMYNRARFAGKNAEAEVYLHWLLKRFARNSQRSAPAVEAPQGNLSSDTAKTRMVA